MSMKLRAVQCSPTTLTACTNLPPYIVGQVGGATGSVGDPSGRSSERSALSPDVLAQNISAISRQVTGLFERGVPFAAKRAGLPESTASNVEFLNNYDWIGKMSLLDFLSGPGKRARVATMLSRER